MINLYVSKVIAPCIWQCYKAYSTYLSSLDYINCALYCKELLCSSHNCAVIERSAPCFHDECTLVTVLISVIGPVFILLTIVDGCCYNYYMNKDAQCALAVIDNNGVYVYDRYTHCRA